MDLISYNAEDLSSLRANEYFFEPASRKIYQYRNKEGKAIIVREVGTPHITKLFKNTLKTVLKVDGEFDKYQVINMSDTSATLFNVNVGETFDVGFGDADNIEEMKNSFNKGDEIIAEIFDYDDIRQIIKLSVASTAQDQETPDESNTEVSEAELKRIKEIEEKKAKKRPFSSSGPAKEEKKVPVKQQKTPLKTTIKSSKKVEAKVSQETKKVEKKPVKEEVQKPKKETKEEKKAREKREKEEQKEREKREKEEKKKKKGKK